jgi:hypothetical protein
MRARMENKYEYGTRSRREIECKRLANAANRSHDFKRERRVVLFGKSRQK